MDLKLFGKATIYGLLVSLILILQACNSQGAATPAPATSPTVTPYLTPTSVLPDQIILSKYTHPDNRFSADYPDNWQLFEQPDGMILLDPNGHVGYSVVFTDVGQIYSPEELNQYLVTFVAQNFAGEGSNFQAISQETISDDLVVARFASIDPDLGPAISEVRIFRKDTIIFVVYFSTIEEQWETSHRKLQKLADGFTPLDTSVIAEPSPTPEPPIWTLIGPESKTFGFLYADNWEVLEMEQNLVSVGLSEPPMIFTASKSTWPQAKTDPAASKKAALAHLETLLEEFETIQNLPPADFPLHTATGTTIDFVYTTGEGLDMAGSVITAVNDGNMHKVVFTAPAEFYDAALQWFNPMYKSFKFLEPEKFETDEP